MNNNFSYSAIGDNSPENREHLEKVGKICINDNTDKYLVTHENAFYSVPKANVAFDCESYISYLHSDALFQVVTAMKDDSDHMQWFVYNNQFASIPMHLCKDYEFTGVYKSDGVGRSFESKGYYHKASLAELKEHFK